MSFFTYLQKYQTNVQLNLVYFTQAKHKEASISWLKSVKINFVSTLICLSCLVSNYVIDQLATRLVVPLTKNTTKNNLYMKNLTPEIEFEGETYLFLAQQLSSIPEDVLKDCIGSLEQSRELLIGAIDFAITGI